jgi:hypothetical protein
MIELWGERPDGRPFSLGDMMALPFSRQGCGSGALFIATKHGWSSSIADFGVAITGGDLLGYSSDQWRYINGIKLPNNSVSWPRGATLAIGASAAAALAHGIARLNAWRDIIGEGPPPPDDMLAFVGLIPEPMERSFHLCILQYTMPVSTAMRMPFTRYEKDYLDERNSGR